MKYYIIAGEASGDLHGSNLIRAIRQRDPKAEIRCWGGDLMESAGATLVKHYRELAFMGFAEVVMHLRTILRNLSDCKKDIAGFAPDVLILIDYPGFNLRIAQWARARKLKVVYYIAPQVWAWKANRVKMMKQCIDRLLVILPFEKSWFWKEWNWEVDYVGHPLVQVVEGFQPRLASLSERPVIAILPGSRRQEILAKLPVMLEVSRSFPEYQFIVAMAPGMDESVYHKLMAPYGNVSSVKGLTYELLSQAEAAMVTSGTATLETALFGVPEVVCYKGNPISYRIARKLIKIKYISLVNLIMDEAVVKELIQHEMNTANLSAELRRLLQDKPYRQRMEQRYAQLREKLAAGGPASDNAADIIMKVLKERRR